MRENFEKRYFDKIKLYYHEKETYSQLLKIINCTAINFLIKC